VTTTEQATSARTPELGDIVRYTLTEQDADAVNARRAQAVNHFREHRDRADGTQVHIGNAVRVGDVYPLVITRVWGTTPTSAVNGQVLLDGSDTLWVSSVQQGDGPRCFTYPPHA
jgi:hypothetical protein